MNTDGTEDTLPATHVRFRVLAWLCAAAFIAYVHRNSIGAAEKQISEELSLSTKQMGAVMSVFFFSYALMQIPAGWLGHVWGSRRGLCVFSVVWSSATGLMGLCGGLWSLGASRLTTGAAQAGLFPCCTNTISHWFPVWGRAFPSGALASCMSIGGAVGIALTGVLLDWMSWRWIYALYALFGFLWAAGFYFWFRDAPSQHQEVNGAEQALIRGGRSPSDAEAAESGRHVATPWTELLSSVAMWWICGQQFFRAAGYIFFATWFPRYLQETRGVSVKESALFTTLPLIGIVVGSLLGGYVMDCVFVKTGSRRASRQGVAVVSMAACAGLVFVAYFIQDVTPAVLTIATASFCAGVGGPASYAITIDMGGRHVATVFSTMNMSGNLGAALFPYVVPWLQEWYGWSSVLLLFGALYVGAGICWLLLNPEGSVFDQALIRSDKEYPA